jgi:hypothetical protein
MSEESDKNPNPQGKGLTIVLRDLLAHQEGGFRPRPKSLEELSDELFTALFVLHSDCKFLVAPGQTAYLYRLDGRYKMLMLAPEDWAVSPPGDFWATCHLNSDMSWSVELSPRANNDAEFQAEVVKARQDFQLKLEQVEQMKDALPHHLQELGYQQRVLAYALARSLQTSMELSGIAQLSYAQAKGLLGKGQSSGL